MNLDIPIIRQQKNSSDCGLACLSMIMDYYNINNDITKLRKSIKVYKWIGTYAPQLGKYLLENDFEVEIITMNPYLFTKNIKIKSHKGLIKYFEDLYNKTKNTRFKKPLKFFKEFIELGGKLTLKVPTIDDIKEEISSNRPLCTLITSNFLLWDKAGFNFHFNVITGIDKDHIYVNDPLEDYRGWKQKYKINDFMYAIYASAHWDIDNASIMKIKKK